MDQASALVFQLVQGFGLAACAGMRTFLPLFFTGLAGRLEWIPLSERFDWLSSTPALTVFGVAVVVELLADKFPWVDNALDAAQLFVKPIAGTMLAASVLTDLGPLETTVLAIVTGGTVAPAIHLGKAKVRLLSSAVSGGLANPVISVVEDGGTLTAVLMAIFVPFALLVVLLVATWWVWSMYRRRRARSAHGGP